MKKSDLSPPYGRLGICLAVDSDGHRDRELSQPAAQCRRLLLVPAADGFTQGQGQLFSCEREEINRSNMIDLFYGGIVEQNPKMATHLLSTPMSD